MPDIRILHIIDSLERGGAETLVVNTITSLQQKYPGCQQYLVTLYKEGELLPQVREQVTHVHLGFRKTNLLAVVLRLRVLLKKWEIDVAHSHLLHSTFISRLVLPANVKLVSTYHSVYYDPQLVDYARKELIIDRLTYRRRYYSIFVSEAVRANICQAVGIRDRYRVLVNFASPAFRPSYRFSPSPALKIVMVGNLRPVKNHEIAVRALSRFISLPVSVDIYGEGSNRPQLEELIRQTGANVTLKGAKAISSALLADYDLFMLTSHHEGMPISLLEAMQTGLPSLLNDLPMLRETAGDGGIYYQYNSLNSLVASIEKILDNKIVLAELSDKALTRSRGFSADKYVDALMRVYTEKK